MHRTRGQKPSQPPWLLFFMWSFQGLHWWYFTSDCGVPYLLLNSTIRLNIAFYLSVLAISSQLESKDTYSICFCWTPVSAVLRFLGWHIVFALKDLVHKTLKAKLVLSNITRGKWYKKVQVSRECSAVKARLGNEGWKSPGVWSILGF
jgi:hypothetical protein